MSGESPAELHDALLFAGMLGTKRGQDQIEREARSRLENHFAKREGLGKGTRLRDRRLARSWPIGNRPRTKSWMSDNRKAMGSNQDN